MERRKGVQSRREDTLSNSHLGIFTLPGLCILKYTAGSVDRLKKGGTISLSISGGKGDWNRKGVEVRKVSFIEFKIRNRFGVGRRLYTREKKKNSQVSLKAKGDDD